MSLINIQSLSYYENLYLQLAFTNFRVIARSLSEDILLSVINIDSQFMIQTKFHIILIADFYYIVHVQIVHAFWYVLDQVFFKGKIMQCNITLPWESPITWWDVSVFGLIGYKYIKLRTAKWAEDNNKHIQRNELQKFVAI